MPELACDLARRLAAHAEAVCRHYLSNGRRQGRYWLVGDASNTPGRSLYVRLKGPDAGKGAAGKWTDAATDEHGDLLDLIAANCRLHNLRDALDEARRFLGLPLPEPTDASRRELPAPIGSQEAAHRLFATSRPIAGTIAETYLHMRGIGDLRNCDALRFHPRCWYRGDADDPRDQARDAWPALIAAITDLNGEITGVHRTWLDPSGRDKALVSTPRRAMGNLLGNAVRFGDVVDVMAGGEGIETMLSLRMVLPSLPIAAALSANHLAAITLSPKLRRLYIARDNDPAGHRAAETLTERASEAGIEALTLAPALGDFNDDLRTLGIAALAAAIRVQLVPEDVAVFWGLPTGDFCSGAAAGKREIE